MSATAPPVPVDPEPTGIDFPAMGGHVHVLALDAPADALSRARSAVHALEQRWSRFLPDSEVARINAADGRPVSVSTTTATLVTLAVHGWVTTDGAYDPTVLDAVVGAGYDRSFEHIALRETAPATTAPRVRFPGPPPGCAGIAVDVDRGIVRVPAEVHIDPGGIGKGLAADLVATTLVADGASGALVNVSGDLRTAGAAPPGGWRIDVDLPATVDTVLALRAGGVATSGTHRRQWIHNGRRAHHLIDPRTGAPSTSPFVAATVVAGTAWRAEILTKAVLLADTTTAAVGHLEAAGAAALVLDADSRTRDLAGFDRFRP
jgi:thiamine biosynthesis lipoprotein